MTDWLVSFFQIESLIPLQQQRPNTIASWMEDISKLNKVLTYHILFGDVLTENLLELSSAETVEGSVVGIDTSDGIKINDAKLITPVVLADNGVIHIIDVVLMPALVGAQSN